jgi:hypothetical protein
VGVRRRAASAAAAAVESSAAKHQHHITLYHTLSFPQSSMFAINQDFDRDSIRSRVVVRKGGHLHGFSLRCVALRRVDYVPNEYSMICTHYATMQFNSFCFAICIDVM